MRRKLVIGLRTRTDLRCGSFAKNQLKDQCNSNTLCLTTPHSLFLLQGHGNHDNDCSKYHVAWICSYVSVRRRDSGKTRHFIQICEPIIISPTNGGQQQLFSLKARVMSFMWGKYLAVFSGAPIFYESASSFL